MKRVIGIILSIITLFPLGRKPSFAEETTPAKSSHLEKEIDFTDNVFEDVSILSKSYGNAKTNKERHLIIESKIAELETKKRYINKEKQKTPIEKHDKRKKINKRHKHQNRLAYQAIIQHRLP